MARPCACMGPVDVAEREAPHCGCVWCERRSIAGRCEGGHRRRRRRRRWRWRWPSRRDTAARGRCCCSGDYGGVGVRGGQPALGRGRGDGGFGASRLCGPSGPRASGVGRRGGVANVAVYQRCRAGPVRSADSSSGGAAAGAGSSREAGCRRRGGPGGCRSAVPSGRWRAGSPVRRAGRGSACRDSGSRGGQGPRQRCCRWRCWWGCSGQRRLARQVGAWPPWGASGWWKMGGPLTGWHVNCHRSCGSRLQVRCLARPAVAALCAASCRAGSFRCAAESCPRCRGVGAALLRCGCWAALLYEP